MAYTYDVWSKAPGIQVAPTRKVSTVRIASVATVILIITCLDSLINCRCSGMMAAFTNNGDRAVRVLS